RNVGVLRGMRAARWPSMHARWHGQGLEHSSSVLGRLGAVGLLTLALGACQRTVDEGQRASTSAPSAAASSSAPVDMAEAKRPFAPARAGCKTVPVFTAGEANGSVCVDDASANGLTIIDLSDAWTPRVFAPDPETGSAPEYRAKYLELANQANA